MTGLELIRPDITHELQAIDYIKEHKDNNEFDLHGGALIEKAKTYTSWLKQLAENSDRSTVNKDWVISSTFFAIRKCDKKIIGMADIRHELNNFLRSYGGHIGIGVRPAERKKGYAIEITKNALKFCNEIGLSKVMVACNKDNIASRNIIRKYDGIVEKEFIHNDGNVVQIYWISIGS